jgi:hypothetical protein
VTSRAALALEALVFVLLAVVAADLYAHKRTDLVAGRNIWGYRGPVAHQKEANEIRFEVVGGTRAFALGMPATWTPATVVQQQVMLAIDRPGGVVRHFIALNLAQPSALPDSYPATIDHFAYLRPNIICLYDDLGVGGSPLLDETSGLYARTGYFPVLPLVLTEKHSRVLQLTGAAFGRIDRALAHAPASRHTDPRAYASDMMSAIRFAGFYARGVIVVISPAETEMQSRNRAALLEELRTRTASRPIRLVDLGGVRELMDPVNRLPDGWNYGGDGVAAASRAIAPAVLELIKGGPERPALH